MAGPGHLKKLVGDFYRLWKTGHSASLKIRTQTGQAWATLQVGLGSYHPAPPPPHNELGRDGLHPPPPHPLHAQGKNSKLRRKERRAEARRIAAEQVAKDAEEALKNEAEQTSHNAEKASKQEAEIATRSVAENVTKDAEETSEKSKIAAENASKASTEITVVEAITTNGNSPSCKTPPPFRPSSLLFPPDPPLKQIPNPEASKVAKNLTDQLQTISRPPDTNDDIDPLYSLAIAAEALPSDVKENMRLANPTSVLRYLEHIGYTYDFRKKCFSKNELVTKMVKPTASEPSLPQTPHQLKPFSQHDPPDPPKKSTPQPMASQVARNLTPLFQLSPRKSQLLQKNNPALRSLPDEIQHEIRKKIKKEEGRVQKNPQWKIVTERKNFLEAAQHKCIMDVTEAHGYRFDPNQKCFRTIENWYTDW